jgi:hypothetical protein
MIKSIDAVSRASAVINGVAGEMIDLVRLVEAPAISLPYNDPSARIWRRSRARSVAGARGIGRRCRYRAADFCAGFIQ